MKKTFTLSVPTPCNEKWEEFNPTTLGGFCSSCQKEVIDFTSWDEDQIKSYFKNQSQTSCGRFFPEQLKNYTLQEAPKFNFLRWTFVPLVSLVMLFFSRNAQAQKMGKTRIERAETARKVQLVFGDTVQVKVITGIVKAAEDQSPLPGVNVILKGTAIGTATDADGRFSISISNPTSTDSLVFSFIGLETASLNVNDANVSTVFLKLDTMALGVSVVAGGICVRRFSLRNLGWRIGNLFRRN